MAKNEKPSKASAASRARGAAKAGAPKARAAKAAPAKSGAAKATARSGAAKLRGSGLEGNGASAAGAKKPVRKHEVPSEGGRYSQSLSHGLAILASFDADHPTLGIADMADRLSMSRSTTHRYATTLAELGYLEQNSSRRYRLTPRAADLGQAALSAMSLREPARGALEELRLRTGRSVSLAILAGSEALLVDRLRGWRGLHEMDLRLGSASRMPLHCTAVGKVLLAQLPQDKQRELLATLSLGRRGPGGITGKRALREELERVREQGYAIDDEEFAAGLLAIAVPVRDGEGLGFAAIGVAVPAKVFAAAALWAEFGEALNAAAEAVTAEF